MRRIAIVGCSGRGKSTLARALGERLGLPVIHLDALFWKPGWVESFSPIERSGRLAAVDDKQLDLFSTVIIAGPSEPSPPADTLPPLAAHDLDDDALIAAIPQAGPRDAVALARDAGRRGLSAAVPALEVVLRRHAGFGYRGPVIDEQAAALDALAAIGGAGATRAVTRAIAEGIVQGATLAVAVSAAARLGAGLPPDRLLDLLGHDDPAVRADACRCARPQAEIQTRLVELLKDSHPAVRAAAARALGRMGRVEALPVLLRLLLASPDAEVVEAIAEVADDDAIVLLGRTARARPNLAGAILEGLEGRDEPLALKVAARLRKSRPPGLV